MAWTDEMVEELKRLWDQGITTGEIGRRLGISKNSIVGKVHRLGLEGRPSPIKKNGDAPETKAPKTASKPSKSSKPAQVKSDKKSAETPKALEPSKSSSKPVEKAKTKKAEKKVDEPLKDTQPLKAPKSFAKPLADEPKFVAPKIEKTEKVYKENISLTELDNHTCRWPLGDPKDEDFRFCGRKVKTGQTYCEEHAAIAYVKPVRK